MVGEARQDPSATLTCGDAPVDVPRVRNKILGTILSAFLAGSALVGRASTAPAATAPVAPKVIDLGDGTYSITCTAKDGFHRDIPALKAEALEDAANYCAAQGKQLKVVDTTKKKPWFSLGYCSATVVFKALSPGDPELAAAPAPVEYRGVVAQVTPLQRPTTATASQQPAPVAPAQPPATPAAAQPPAQPTVQEKPVTSGDLYTALLQLDDLRKRGILTEEEFQAEKQKVLKRSQ